MVEFGFVAALLCERADDTMRDHWLLLAVRTLPVTMMCSAVIYFPLTPVVLVVFACWPLKRLAQSGSGVAELSRTCRGLISGRFRPSPRG